MERQVYEITLPLPPSVNAAYKNIGRGRARTAKYNQWKQEAWLQLREQFPNGGAKLQGRIRVEYTLLQADKLKRDIANFEKCTTDFLSGIFFDDDSQIDQIFMIRKYTQGKKNFMHVRMRELTVEDLDNGS